MVTSKAAGSVSPPVSSASADAAPTARSRSRPCTTTRAPAVSRPRASAYPIPRVEPVTSAVRPARSNRHGHDAHHQVQVAPPGRSRSLDDVRASAVGGWFEITHALRSSDSPTVSSTEAITAGIDPLPHDVREEPREEDRLLVRDAERAQPEIGLRLRRVGPVLDRRHVPGIKGDPHWVGGVAVRTYQSSRSDRTGRWISPELQEGLGELLHRPLDEVGHPPAEQHRQRPLVRANPLAKPPVLVRIAGSVLRVIERGGSDLHRPIGHRTVEQLQDRVDSLLSVASNGSGRRPRSSAARASARRWRTRRRADAPPA